MSVEELAERAGTSPSFVRRLEKGGLKGEMGIAFEVASIAGVNLFTPEASGTKAQARLNSLIAQ
ncbi:MAG: helix-turn-helix transcriptional regulator, partial [Marinobacter sp.]